MKVFNFSRAENKYEGFLVGMEIETEGRRLPGPAAMAAVKNWKAVTDGSLRGESYEYIFVKPVSKQKAVEQLQDMRLLMEKGETVLEFSSRTSVHVHVNVLDLEFQELTNLVYLYYIFEDAILRLCGEDRYTNRFCLSVRQAEAIIYDLVKRLNPNYVGTFRQEFCKYSALNLAPIQTQGSIEFRGMRGTLDVEVLSLWLSIIESLYNASKQFKNPKEIRDKCLGIGIKKVAKQIFGNILPSLMFNQFEEEVMYNISICAELPEALTLKQDERLVAVKKVAMRPKMLIPPAGVDIGGLLNNWEIDNGIHPANVAPRVVKNGVLGNNPFDIEEAL